MSVRSTGRPGASEGSLTAHLRFQWSWRPYQARVLKTVERHLEDGRLHIVAAPGAGKTTLGLEVFRRIGRPALVLAPTLTIRDQWLRRLRDFLGPRDREDPSFLTPWTSSDLAAPAFFTVATYQAVLSRARREAEQAEEDPELGPEAPSEEEVGTLVGTLRAAGVGTLILDEAHHLKRAWWRALQRVVESLEDVTLLSLTGTPPYDATGVEWRRYEELCGPIDDEISAPELVKAGTLCPHQDFVHAVTLPASERERLRAHDEVLAGTLVELLDDPRLHGEVDGHPWVATESPDLDAVLGDPELGVALLSFLRATGAGLPPGLLAALALEPHDVPSLDRRWWQVLLHAYLFGSTFEPDPGTHASLRSSLRERGLLWRRTLRVARSEQLERSLALSTVKVDGCVAIHEAERAVRGEALRQVVLTDFIRAEALEAEPGAASTDLGAVPVFDALVSARLAAGSDPSDVALVSGTLALVHRDRLAALRAHLRDPSALRATGVESRPGWMRLEGVRSGRLVAAYTRLLTRGELRTLVGTRALLGEGWDAPAVSSLVLASAIGATVGTNQMRGRAIRTDPERPDKVASVWHLVAVSPETPSGLLDLEALRRRFETFVGLSADGSEIVSGLERLALPPVETEADVAALNRESVRRLGELEGVAEDWRAAIERSAAGQVVPTVSFRRPPTLRPLHVTRTLRYALLEAGLASVMAFGEVVRRIAVGGGGGGGLGWTIISAAAIPMLLLAPKLARAVKLAVLHAPVAGSVEQIGRAVLEALTAVGLVEVPEGARVRTGRLPKGGVHVSLEGGSFYDQSLFADAVGEVLGPVANPRYLITRPARALLRERVDYHAVPHALGAKRERAEAFLEAWRRHVGPGELVYTRREGGRAALLAARGRALSSRFVDPAERLDRWQ